VRESSTEMSISVGGGRRKTATEKFAQLGTKLSAGDQVDVKVVGENEFHHRQHDFFASCCEHLGLVAKVTVPHPPGDCARSGCCAIEDSVDDRSGDKHGGGHGRVVGA